MLLNYIDYDGGMTDEAVEAHPVGMSFMTGCAFHLEGVEIWALLGVSRTERGDTIKNG